MRGEGNFVLHFIWEVTEDIPFRQTLLHIHPSAILVVDANQYLIHLVLLIGSTVNMESTGISLWVPDRGGLDLYLFHNNIYIQLMETRICVQQIIPMNRVHGVSGPYEVSSSSCFARLNAADRQSAIKVIANRSKF